MRNSLLMLTTLVLFGSAVGADDAWWQYGGPRRNSVSLDKNLLPNWHGAPPLRWKIENIGSGYSSPVVRDGIVCTMAARDSRSLVVAIDEESGKEKWTTDVDEAIDGGFPGPRSTPAIDGELVYALGEKGKLVCLDLATGKLIWSKDFRADYGNPCKHFQRDFGTPYAVGFGFCESPLIDDDKVICSPKGPKASIVALDKKTGREIWRCAVVFPEPYKRNHKISYTSPVISHAAGIKQYVHVLNQGMVGIEADTGKQLWTYSSFGKGANGEEFMFSPVVHGDFVFCGYHGDRGSILVRILKRKNNFVAEEIYAQQDLQLWMGGYVVLGDHLYIGKFSILQCVELLTGKIVWTVDMDREVGHQGLAGHLAYADSHLYCRSQKGDMLMMSANMRGYQLKGRFHIPGDPTRGEERRQIYNQPAISNGYLYVREGNLLYCYDLKKK